jgi:TP901-1 family phage major tail protein
VASLLFLRARAEQRGEARPAPRIPGAPAGRLTHHCQGDPTWQPRRKRLPVEDQRWRADADLQHRGRPAHHADVDQRRNGGHHQQGSGGWRELLSGAGTRSVTVSAAGIFLGSTAEAQIRANALSGTIADYELSFEGGEKMHGRFLVQRLDYSGDFNGERNYTMTLESSGAVAPA